MNLTNQYTIIDTTPTDWACNRAKLAPNNKIKVETLFRFGNPTYKTYTKKEFKKWREEINN